jgi:hypothetical protein
MASEDEHRESSAE